MDQLSFETVSADQVVGLGTSDKTIQRARVAGGWIVLYDDAKRIKFCPCTAPPSDVAAWKVPSTVGERQVCGVA
jgi:hypothetical protein